MDPYKLERQNSAIRKALGDLVAAELKDPRVGFISVNEVRLNRDQTVAEVFVGVMGEETDRRDSLRGLKKARGFLQGRLGDVLRMRRTPELKFVIDDSLDRGLDVEDILAELTASGEFEDTAARNARRTFDSLEPPRNLLDVLEAAADDGISVWVVPHWNPDPDAIGSALALAAALTARGADARAIGYPDPPSAFAALPGMDDVLSSAEAEALAADDPPDLVVMVDCHRLDRAEDLAPALERAPAAWCIDHHLVEGSGAALPGWIEDVAGSASLLVMRVIESLAGDDADLDPDIAACIYAGLVTDTGGFRFPNTLPLCFEAAERLARTGIDVSDLAEHVLHRRTRSGMELLKRVMATFTFHDSGRIVSLRADEAMLAETGTAMSDTEGFVNLAMAVEGVRFAIFLKERGDGAWRVSLRAQNGGDVQSVAASYGGGGHKLAAGCTLEGDADDVLAGLVAELARQTKD